jgi:hypothetical protein
MYVAILKISSHHAKEPPMSDILPELQIDAS